MTLHLPRAPKVPFDTDPRYTAVLWRASRLERTKRYVTRTALTGQRLYPIGQPWIDGIA